MSQNETEIVLTENPDKFSTLEIYTMLMEHVYNITTDLLVKKGICIHKHPENMRKEDLDLMLREQSSFSYILKSLCLHNGSVPLYLKSLLESIQELVLNKGTTYHSFKSILTDIDIYSREITVKDCGQTCVYKLETELQTLAIKLNEEELLNIIDILKHYEVK